MKNYLIQNEESVTNLTLDDNNNIILIGNKPLCSRIDRSWICTEPGTFVYTYKDETKYIPIEVGDIILRMFSPNDDWRDKRLIVLKANNTLRDYVIEYSENRREHEEYKVEDCEVCESCSPNKN